MVPREMIMSTLIWMGVLETEAEAWLVEGMYDGMKGRILLVMDCQKRQHEHRIEGWKFTQSTSVY